MQRINDDSPGIEEYVPAGHVLHPEAVVSPKAEEYVPAGHFVQSASFVSPVVAAYFPARHGVQTLSCVVSHEMDVYVPLGQLHVLHIPAPFKLYVPGRH